MCISQKIHEVVFRLCVTSRTRATQKLFETLKLFHQKSSNVFFLKKKKKQKKHCEVLLHCFQLQSNLMWLDGAHSNFGNLLL